MAMAFATPAASCPSLCVRLAEANLRGRDDLSIVIALGATSEPGPVCRLDLDHSQA